MKSAWSAKCLSRQHPSADAAPRLVEDYPEAVKQLERAIELKPEDPTINDHLGDAYWRIGRTLEARFQWAHARDLKPDPEDLPKIEQKLKSGLPDETSSQAKALDKPEKKNGNGG